MCIGATCRAPSSLDGGLPYVASDEPVPTDLASPVEAPAVFTRSNTPDTDPWQRLKRMALDAASVGGGLALVSMADKTALKLGTAAVVGTLSGPIAVAVAAVGALGTLGYSSSAGEVDPPHDPTIHDLPPGPELPFLPLRVGPADVNGLPFDSRFIIDETPSPNSGKPLTDDTAPEGQPQTTAVPDLETAMPSRASDDDRSTVPADEAEPAEPTDAADDAAACEDPSEPSTTGGSQRELADEIARRDHLKDLLGNLRPRLEKQDVDELKRNIADANERINSLQTRPNSPLSATSTAMSVWPLHSFNELSAELNDAKSTRDRAYEKIKAESPVAPEDEVDAMERACEAAEEEIDRIEKALDELPDAPIPNIQRLDELAAQWGMAEDAYRNALEKNPDMTPRSVLDDLERSVERCNREIHRIERRVDRAVARISSARFD
jgi:hypothetical protein